MSLGFNELNETKWWSSVATMSWWPVCSSSIYFVYILYIFYLFISLASLIKKASLKYVAQKWKCCHAYGFCRHRRHLTHWGRVTHICISKLTIIGSDNGLSPDRRQAIIWTNAGLLLIGPLGTNFSEILMEILTFSFKKMRLKMSSAKRGPFYLGLNVLRLVAWCLWW